MELHVVPVVTEFWKFKVDLPVYDLENRFSLETFVVEHPAMIWNASVIIQLESLDNETSPNSKATCIVIG